MISIFFTYFFIRVFTICLKVPPTSAQPILGYLHPNLGDYAMISPHTSSSTHIYIKFKGDHGHALCTYPRSCKSKDTQ